jgi:DNA polymerase III subunit gamma/tau
MAWYNIYRPSKFEDVSGQAIVKSVLQNALLHNKVKHGYLLSGPKGTGKTTLARIFANNLNDLDNNSQASMDIIELDAASNSGVDNIRNLIESAKTAPFAGAYKVYIIDEVHMLSKSAMNALLKILEEPPEYLVFLLATTNPEKLLPTVLSRLTKLTLTSHTLQDIIDRLKFIAKTEKMSIDQGSLELIAKRAGGGQRDAINILETLYSYGLDKYTLTETTNLLGLLHTELLSEIAGVFAQQDFVAIKEMITKVEKVGLDGESFLGQLLGFLLEQSFEVGGGFDSLIIPVAEILDLKLPINTISASFGLIQAKLKEKNIASTNTNFASADQKKNPSVGAIGKSKELINNLDTKNQNYEANLSLSREDVADRADVVFQNDTTQNINHPLDKEDQCDSFGEIKNKAPQNGDTEAASTVNLNTILSNPKIESSDSVNVKINSEQNKIETPKQNIQTLLDTIHSFARSPNCAMMFKMIIPQIVVENIEGNMATISLTAPTFVSQLENPKTKKLITDHILEQTGEVFEIQLTTRQLTGVAVKDHRTDKEILDAKLQSEDPSSRYEAPKSSFGKKYDGPTRQSAQTQPKNSDSEVIAKYGKKLEEPDPIRSKTNKPSTKPVEKYFYSVYQGLPANTVGDESEKSKVPVRLEPIQNPIKQELLHDQNPNWAAEIDELFDF